MQFLLSQYPKNNGDVFFNKKKKYSMNTQIVCNLDLYIISLITNWPRSYKDTKIFKKMEIYKNSKKYFDYRQYLLANSTYGMSHMVIPNYKSLTIEWLINREFNYYLIKLEIVNKQYIGILKNK